MSTENQPDYQAMLAVAIKQAEQGLKEGGVPIGAALFKQNGTLLGEGRNRRVQDNDPATHAETDAFRNAGRQQSYQDTIMVTTLAPCWYCSGLIHQFGIDTVVVGEQSSFDGGVQWLQSLGVKVVNLNSAKCRALLQPFIQQHPDIWNEDIGIPPDPGSTAGE